MSAQAAPPPVPPTQHPQPPPTSRRRRTSSSSSSSAPSRAALSPNPSIPSHTRDRWTLYDAVSGRLTTHSTTLLAPSSSRPSAPLRDRLSRSTRPLRPQDALFKATGAPQRFEERDIYDVVGGLPAGARGEGVLRGGVVEGVGAGRKVRWVGEGEGDGDEREEREERRLSKLPDSDLLKAVHAYASDFYGVMRMAAHDSSVHSKRGKRGGSSSGYTRGGDFGSLDETALLAFGVLLEESVAAALGETGDMVFVEGEIAEGLGEDGRSMSRSVTVDAGGEEEGEDEADGEGDTGGTGNGMSKQQQAWRERLKRARKQDEEEERDDDGRLNRRSRKRTKRVHYEGDEDY